MRSRTFCVFTPTYALFVRFFAKRKTTHSGGLSFCIVKRDFAPRYPAKQGVYRADRAQARADDYATGGAMKNPTCATRLGDRNRCRSQNPRRRHGFRGFFMPFPRCKINRCQSRFSPKGREMNLAPRALVMSLRAHNILYKRAFLCYNYLMNNKGGAPL